MPMSDTLAIVNPTSGNGAGLRAWRRIRPSVGWQCALSERRGHARDLARAAAERGLGRVVAVGGDGTISEVVNGLVHTDTALAIIPAGTGNDLAHTLGIPRDSLSAARLAASAPARPIDVGEICGADGSVSYFVNVAGFGFDAEVAWRVNRLPKLVGGTLPYLLGVTQTLWHYRSPHLRLRIDDHVVDEPVFLVAVGNGPSYGGSMRITPGAVPDDGWFDVCVVKALSRLEVLRLVPRLYTGGHVGHPRVAMFRCRSLSADADVRVRCQADGELVGGLPVRFGLLAGALRCVTGPVGRSAS